MGADAQREHLERVKRDADTLARTMLAAQEAGVPHTLILPQLLLVFRNVFGAPPPELAQQMAGLGL